MGAETEGEWRNRAQSLLRGLGFEDPRALFLLSASEFEGFRFCGFRGFGGFGVSVEVV